MKRYSIYISVFFVFPTYSFSQGFADSVFLPNIFVEDSIIYQINDGGNIQSIQRLIIKDNSTLKFNELLQKQTSIYVKQYGALATPSFRGTGASNTLFLWNDIPINSLALGMNDMQLFPVNAFNNIKILSGGNSAFLGSGAVGGSIHLNNNLQFKKNNIISASYQLGSFGFSGNAIGVNKSSETLFIEFRYSLINDENKFPYYNISRFGNPLTYNTHSNTSQQQYNGIISYNLNTNQRLTFYSWNTCSDREIPNTMVTFNSTATQKDLTNRYLLKYTYNRNKFKFDSKFAMLQEIIKYNDNPNGINSFLDNKSYLFKTGLNYNYKNLFVYTGVNYSIHEIVNNNYLNEFYKENTSALQTSISHKSSFISSTFSIRSEQNPDFKTPIVSSFGFYKNIVNGIKLRGRINQNFRIPTFNDRYWTGPYSKGNLDLIPEEGWNQEIGIDLRFLDVNFNITYYSLLIDNMIFWNQENGIWTPVNLRKVLSKGLEFKSVIENNSAYGNFIMVFNYHYNNASNKDPINNFDKSAGKQLRYTPIHKGNISMVIIESNLKLSLIQSYTGKVFTNSDESDFLKSYSLTDVSLSYKFKKYFDFSITAKNILNKNYQSYQGYPNPGKNYLLTLYYNL